MTEQSTAIDQATELKTSLEPLTARLSKDIRAAAKILKPKELRFLVDTYYALQEHRIRQEARLREASADGEPFEVTRFSFSQMQVLENQVRAALNVYSKEDAFCRWARSIVGIGPVLASGLRAHIDIEKCRYAGQLFRFAGQDPSAKWDKGERRPWNAALKTLCWKIGDRFVKQSNHPKDIYGKFYRKRKELEVYRNEAGDFKAHAEAALKDRKIGKDTEAFAAYSIGKLPKGHLDARARRVTVKLFLSHAHDVLHRLHHGMPAPAPYATAHLPGHDGGTIPTPNLDVIGLE